MKYKTKWFLVSKFKNTATYVNHRGYVYDEETKNHIRLYILKKKAMEEIRDLLINYNQTDAPVTAVGADADYVIKFNDGNAKLKIYSQDLFFKVNDLLSNSINRKHADPVADEIPAVADSAPVIVEAPAEGTKEEFQLGTYMRNAYGDLVRVN